MKRELGWSALMITLGCGGVWIAMSELHRYYSSVPAYSWELDDQEPQQVFYFGEEESADTVEIWCPPPVELTEPVQRSHKQAEVSMDDGGTVMVSEWTPKNADEFALHWSMELQLLLDERSKDAAERAKDPVLAAQLRDHTGTVGEFLRMSDAGWDELVQAWCPEVARANAQYTLAVFEHSNLQSAKIRSEDVVNDLAAAYEEGVFAARDVVFQAAAGRVPEFTVVRQLLRRE